MVQGIAQGMGNGARPRQEFLFVRGVAGAKALVDPVGTHGAPFVVVSLQPDLEEILKASIRSHVLRREVTVIVENRLGFGVFVVKAPGDLGREEEIVVNERHGALNHDWNIKAASAAARRSPETRKPTRGVAGY